MPTPEDVRRQRIRAIIGVLNKAGTVGLPRRAFIGQLCIEYGSLPSTIEGILDILCLAEIAEEIGPMIRIRERERERERAKPVKEGKKSAKKKPKAKA